MNFSFGANPSTPKTASGFTLPSSTPASTASGFAFNLTQVGAGEPAKPDAAATPTLNFGLGSAPKTITPTLSFGTPAASAGGLTFGSGTPAATPAASAATTAPTLGFGFGTPASSTTTTSTTSFTPIIGGTTTTSLASSIGLSFGAPVTSSAGTPKLTLGATPAVTTSASTGFSLGGPTTTTSTGFSLGGATTTASSGFSLGGTTTTASSGPSVTTTSALQVPASLTFGQIEDSINKWTLDLEEQAKLFINQAKQLNAWDQLLISNGEKIMDLNGSIERVKQQQSQLHQELDFILAQQKELEELITPLEKELADMPVVDIDRSQMYQFAEVIDSQLKQMSDDLKEIIENINDSNRDQEQSNPISQISKILNAHMDTLQWIDRTTQDINKQINEISKVEIPARKAPNFNQSLIFS